MLYITGASLTMAAMENGANLYLLYWWGAAGGTSEGWCNLEKNMISRPKPRNETSSLRICACTTSWSDIVYSHRGLREPTGGMRYHLPENGNHLDLGLSSLSRDLLPREGGSCPNPNPNPTILKSLTKIISKTLGGSLASAPCSPVCLVELVLELHPVKTQGVEEALENVHAEDDAEGHPGEDGEADEDGERVARLNSRKHRLLPENGGELRVGQRQGPEAEVRGRVGDHAQHELDRLDGLIIVGVVV